jgi:hypothetical protein
MARHALLRIGLAEALQRSELVVVSRKRLRFTRTA